MKLLTAKYLSLALLALAWAGAARADHFMDDTVEDRGGCCFGRQYECSCNPLYCGAFDLQIQGGVDPILWRGRNDFFAVACPIDIGVALSDFLAIPKFNKLFKTPWTVGGQVGYAWSDNTRVYLEFDYSQTTGKSGVDLTAIPTLSGPVIFNLHKYRLFEFYAGARYYWDRWCDRLSIFVGGKIGLVHHKATVFDFTIPVVVPGPAVFTGVNFANSNTSVSGGANIGLDFCICGNWSFVITGEIVASCGPKVNNNIVTTATGLAITNLVAGNIQSELRFPVTAAVRYSF